MDKATFEYYEQNADFCAQRWNAIERNTEASRLLSAALPVDAGLGRVDVWSDWADLQGREGYSWDALFLERSDEIRRF